MPRKSKTDQDAGFMRSFWDEVREMQVDYGVVVGVYVHPSNRTGVFVFRLIGAQAASHSVAPIGTQAMQFEYPTGDLLSLPGALWRGSMKLHEMCVEAHKIAASQVELPF